MPTFLFTDIEGSTRLWEEHPETMRTVLAEHDRLLRCVIEAHGGAVFKTVGDAFCAAFLDATDALAAARDAQEQLDSLHVNGHPVRVRMALHSGPAEQRDHDYFGPVLNRTARLVAIGHGGQVLLSQATYALLSDTAGLGDLGLHRLKDLQQPEHVWQWGDADFAPLRSLALYDNNLPLQVTSFVGREKEVAQLKEKLADTRLLTLTGSGGCGKTRLALQVSAERLEHYAGGVWLVELAPLTDPALVPYTVAEVLGVRAVPGEPLVKTLTDALKSKSLLLILDNCEHVIDAAAALATALLRGCPDIHLLVSSREALSIAGEQTFLVPSLSLPDPRESQTPLSLYQYESARLLIERATLHQPTFAVTPNNASTVAALCKRLDGIPLAIELAAARVRSMSLEQLSARLDDRFRLLTGGSRTALPRQQTLRALIDWSYDLLTEREKLLFCRLSVFAGGWSLEAAEKVCADARVADVEILDLLTALTDKSLVLYDAGSLDGGRYRLLETVREYATEHLSASGDADRVRLQHRAVFADFAEEASSHLRDSEQPYWLPRLDLELENCRQALALALPAAEHEGIRLAIALAPYLIELRGCLSEASAWLERHGAASDTIPATRAAQARGFLGQAYWRQGEYATARLHYERALALWKELGVPEGIAQTTAGLANVTYYQGNYADAEPLYAEALRLAQESGDTRNTARAYNNCALVASARARWDEALRLFESSLALRRVLGDRLGEGTVLGNLIAVYEALDRHDEAQHAAEASLAIGEELGDPMTTGYCWQSIGRLAQKAGDFPRAYAAYGNSLAIRHGIGERYGVLSCLQTLMQLMRQEGRLAEAAELLGVVDTLRQEMETRMSDFFPEEETRWRDALQAELSPERFAQHYQRGCQESRERVIVSLSSRSA